MSNTAANMEPGAGRGPTDTPTSPSDASFTEGTAANDAPGDDQPAAFETLLGDVPLLVTVELGRVRLPLREVGDRLSPGSIIPLSKLTGETLDIRVNDRLVAHAEAIAIGERYGVRIVDIVSGGESR